MLTPEQEEQLKKHNNHKIKIINLPKDTKCKEIHNSSSPQNIQKTRESLPIHEYKKSLIDALKKYKNLIIVGETGSGKTTQIPQYILESIHIDGIIGITQPRRVAAITIATRVSKEMNVKLGKEVGYSIRFEDVSDKNTKIKFMTDGVLLREIQYDPLLEKYSVIILDEIHERTLNTDILFGLQKRIQKERNNNLQIIAMSATIDPTKFSKYFFNAPVIYIPGRKYIVDIYYTKKEIYDTIDAIVRTTIQVHLRHPQDGDILVFLSGSEEIQITHTILETQLNTLCSQYGIYKIPPYYIIEIYSRLPSEKQLEVFTPTSFTRRKIILATNIAETSITISGIKYIIDSGKCKIKRLNPINGMDILEERYITRAEAFQRAGRSGREFNGICYRLYTQDMLQKKFQADIVPEILSTSMENVILQLKNFCIDDPYTFDFLDQPPKKNLQRSIIVLQNLLALDRFMYLTNFGRLLCEFPLHPSYSAAILYSAFPPSKDIKNNTLYTDFLYMRYENTNYLCKNTNNTNSIINSTIYKNDFRHTMYNNSSTIKEHLETLHFLPCSKEMIAQISILSVDNILIVPPKITTPKKIYAKYILYRKQIMSQYGDLNTLLYLFLTYQKINDNRKNEWCKERFLNIQNLRKALLVQEQLVDICKRLYIPITAYTDLQIYLDEKLLITQDINTTNSTMSYDPIRKCLAFSMFDHIIHRLYKMVYTSIVYKTCDEIYIHPTSCIHANISSIQYKNKTNNGEIIEDPWEYILYTELLYTRKNYARNQCVIKHDWVEEVIFYYKRYNIEFQDVQVSKSSYSHDTSIKYPQSCHKPTDTSISFTLARPIQESKRLRSA